MAFIVCEKGLRDSLTRLVSRCKSRESAGSGFSDPIRSLADSDWGIFSSFPWSSVGMRTGAAQRRVTSNVHHPLFSSWSRLGLFSARMYVNNSGRYAFPRRTTCPPRPLPDFFCLRTGYESKKRLPGVKITGYGRRVGTRKIFKTQGGKH